MAETIARQQTPEEARQEIFGRGVIAILDGTEWNSDTFDQIKELADSLNIFFREPDEGVSRG